MRRNFIPSAVLAGLLPSLTLAASFAGIKTVAVAPTGMVTFTQLAETLQKNESFYSAVSVLLVW